MKKKESVIINNPNPVTQNDAEKTPSPIPSPTKTKKHLDEREIIKPRRVLKSKK